MAPKSGGAQGTPMVVVGLVVFLLFIGLMYVLG
jgi:hypothetical protein